MHKQVLLSNKPDLNVVHCLCQNFRQLNVEKASFRQHYTVMDSEVHHEPQYRGKIGWESLCENWCICSQQALNIYPQSYYSYEWCKHNISEYKRLLNSHNTEALCQMKKCSGNLSSSRGIHIILSWHKHHMTRITGKGMSVQTII